MGGTSGRRCRLSGTVELAASRSVSPPGRPVNQSRTPFLLSLIAAAAGLVGLLSALTPEWPLRLRIVQDVLSPTGPSVADGLVVACSIALLVLARGLARRRHRAWQVAMVLLGAGAVLHV